MARRCCIASPIDWARRRSDPVGIFTRPQLTVTVGVDNVEVQGAGAKSRSDLEPTFHVVRRARPAPGEAPWVIVGGPDFEPTQPGYVLNLFRRQEWPAEASLMWGDYVALLFAYLMPREKRLPWRRPDVHVHVHSLRERDRVEFETRSRDTLVRCGASSVDFEWT